MEPSHAETGQNAFKVENMATVARRVDLDRSGW